MARVIGDHLFYVVFFLNDQLQCLLVVAHTTWKTKTLIMLYDVLCPYEKFLVSCFSGQFRVYIER